MYLDLKISLIVGAPPSALFWQELSDEQEPEAKKREFNKNQLFFTEYRSKIGSISRLYTSNTDCLRNSANKIDLPDKFQYSSTTSCSTNYEQFRSSYSSTIRISRSQSSIYTVFNEFNIGMFGKKETEVYMTLYEDYCQCRASGTQATALINKCLQVSTNIGSRCDASTIDTNSNYESSCTVSSLPSHYSRRRVVENTRYHDVYFFGRKKEAPKSTGMGCQDSNAKLHRTGQSSSTAVKSEKGGPNTVGICSTNQASSCSSSCVQTKNTRGASTATNTSKAVSINDEKPKKPCPALGGTKGDMSATVSHIRIGPKEPCPVHGKESCQGPKCIVASSGEEQAPVKVTTVTNPRRGVFELVIRRMTGAPLAKNELMLEWTPPSTRPPPCGGPCPIPCTVPTPCRPSKCKLIICKPSPCKPRICKKPCGLSPCRSSKCSKCCKKICCSKKCIPCGPPACNVPCAPPCCKSPCRLPCKSSPCLRPCPVGRKRPRRARSQPKIKMHRKRTSPCLNRSKACPVVRCRSMPAPCVECCAPAACPLRKCCSVAPYKPPKCCKSSCSLCCI